MKTAEADLSVDWSSYAEVYDLMAEENPAYSELREEVLRLVDELDLKGCNRIADLGAGTGQYSLALARSCPRSRVVHAEPDTAMIAAARKKIGDVPLSNLEIVNAPASSLLFDEESLDLCTCVHALYTVENPHETLGWMHSWLKPGGVLVLCDLGRVLDIRDWGRFILKHMIRKHGLVRALWILWSGRQVSRQNRVIAQRQMAEQYWTNTSRSCRQQLSVLALRSSMLRFVIGGIAIWLWRGRGAGASSARYFESPRLFSSRGQWRSLDRDRQVQNRRPTRRPSRAQSVRRWRSARGHGLLASAASCRDRIMPTAEEEVGESCVKHQGRGVSDGRGIGTPKPKGRKKRLLWDEAMNRGLGLDVLTSPPNRSGPCGRQNLKEYLRKVSLSFLACLVLLEDR